MKKHPKKAPGGHFHQKEMLLSSCSCAPFSLRGGPEEGLGTVLLSWETRRQEAATEYYVPSRGLAHIPSAPGLSQVAWWWGYHSPHFRDEG